MDNHLNIFYSYNQGKLGNIERTSQLEDNHTRALITTLMNISANIRIKIISNILKVTGIISKELDFDLQNTDKDIKGRKNYLLILQRVESNISEDSLKINKKLLQYLDGLDAHKKEDLVNAFNKHIQEGKDFEHEKIGHVPYQELLSYSQLLTGNRPDGWIIGDKEIVLIETKIGENTASNYQIYRHLTCKNGLKISANKINSCKIINLTWIELAKFFDKVKSNNIKDKFLINQLLKYISMTGQKLDFSYITDKKIDEKIDNKIHKEQFSLFLQEFDAELHKQQLSFFRKKRQHSQLWDFYGLRNNQGEISKDPHYTVGFRDKEISIYLTTTKKHITSSNNNDAQNVLFEEKLKEFYDTVMRKCAGSKEKELELSRFFIAQKKYKLLDPQKGAQRGETIDPFTYRIHFSEIKKRIKTITEIILVFSNLGICKQFELGYAIQFFDFSRTREDSLPQLRKSNRYLLMNPDKLIKKFAEFIKETKDIFDVMDN